MQGTVLTGRNNIFTVDSPAGVLLCRLKGKTLQLDERSYNPLAPGDVVSLSSVDPANGSAVIDAREQRASSFSRFNRKRDAVQTLAANIDLVAAVSSLARPFFKNRFVDRVLVLACYHGVTPALIVTKSDLSSDHAEITDRYERLGVIVRVCSAETGDGIGEVLAALQGRRTVLVGQSGVGKSTLVNLLLGEAAQDVGATDRFHRGRHTTSAGRLLHGDGFEIIDTPGVRELDCRHVPLPDIGHCFPEFVPIAPECDHTDCSHRTEPGCAVVKALEAGRIDAVRYESYVRLFDEIEDLQEEL